MRWACFLGADASLVLMRNHELAFSHGDPGPYFPGQLPPPEAYDADLPGGVTRVVLDAETLAVRSSNLVLAGTTWNCAGGKSPWGWLSCEETFEPNHGYVFLCDPAAARVQPARRIDGYGRFRHEAAAVDPRTLIAYLTEDRPDASFYRFVPEDAASDPFAGKLQALRVRDRNGVDTSALRAGESVSVDWLDIPITRTRHRRQRARAGASARAPRASRAPKGCGSPTATRTLLPRSAGRSRAARCSDSTSDAEPRSRSSPRPATRTCSTCPTTFDVVAARAAVRLRGRTRRQLPAPHHADGTCSAFARNAASMSEFAGPCFSPDGARCS